MFGMLGLVLTGLILMAATPSKAAIVTIDDFAAGVNLSTLGPIANAINDGPHAGVLGAFRDTNLSVDSGMAVQVFYSPVNTQTLVFAGFPGSTGTYTSVYDGFNTGGSLNANLVTADFNDRFQVVVLDANGNADITISVVDTGNVASSLTKQMVDGVNGPIDFLFSDYASNMTTIKSLTLTIATTSVAADFTLGSVRAIPEPASAALIGLGGLLMLRRPSRRRRLA